MKKIVPFTKEINFKTKINEITSISLDHTLKLNNNVVNGEFIIKGLYKFLDNEKEFNYNIPLDITIDNKYDTSNCIISIDDFSYEIINEEILKVNISVMLDDLDIKENIEKVELDVRDDIELINLEEDNTSDINVEVEDSIVKEKKVETDDLFNSIDDSKEYSIYRVYTFKEDDTIDLILEKYKITKEILSDYNNLDNITVGSKLIIPSVDEE